MSQNIKMIITFLTSHNYEHEISVKILQSPTGRDFNNIVGFLGRFFDPSFTITKPEDDIPNLFKSLKYHTQISKKGLSSVAAPHTWPTMLGALAWLVELLVV
jgi:kinetochore protein NDC80